MTLSVPGMRARSRSCALVASLVFAGSVPAADVGGVDANAAAAERGADACGSLGDGPKMLSSRAGAIPDGLWDTRASWDAHVVFRLDEAGAPRAARVTVIDPASAEEAEAATTSETFSGYRFCLPRSFSSQAEWVARMHFGTVRLGERAGRAELFTQVFVPAYTRDDLATQRSGKAVVRGLFDVVGRPVSVGVVESSGDPVLDAKTIDAMASYRLVDRNPERITFPLAFVTPYIYRIR